MTMNTTFEAPVRIDELAQHGAGEFVLNALRRCDIFMMSELAAALARHDAALAAGFSTTQFLLEDLPGIGLKKLAGAREAFARWKAAQPSTEETS
jgi:hypothetical protein